MPSTRSQPVFICYAHADCESANPKERWMDRLLAFLKPFVREELIQASCDRDLRSGDDWHQELQRKLQGARAAVLLVGPHFLASTYIANVELPALLTAAKNGRLRLFPVLVAPCSFSKVRYRYPNPVAGPEEISLSVFQAANAPEQTLVELAEAQQNRTLVRVAEEIVEHLASTGTSVVLADEPPRAVKRDSPFQRDVSRMPASSPELFGRGKHLRRITLARNGGSARLISIIAGPGTGKTALANRWLNHSSSCANTETKVFAWSFYTQAVGERANLSSDPFFAAASEFFDVALPTNFSSWRKGQILGRAIAQRDSILLLDGLEPLQQPPASGTLVGRLKNPNDGILSLLSAVAAHNSGFCVVTSRLPLSDVAGLPPTVHLSIPLEQLDSSAGAKLLRHLLSPPECSPAQRALARATPESDLRQAAADFGGNALALRLLGNYIAVAYGGDIRRRDTIRALLNEPNLGGHARRIMVELQDWFAGKPEAEFLRLLGLFDRPAGMALISAVSACSEGTRFAPLMRNISEARRNICISNLLRSGLITWTVSGAIDCHPVVRSYFAERFEKEDRMGWIAAHTFLFAHFSKAASSETPETLTDMEPLFRAVAHGCQAGLHQRALDDVYWSRVLRGDRHYTVVNLGALGEDLAVLAHFFEDPWTVPSRNLAETDRTVLFGWAGYRLRGLGRLLEAKAAFLSGLDARLLENDAIDAARVASYTSEVSLLLGDIPGAIRHGQQSLECAEVGGDLMQMAGYRTTLGDAFHKAGQLTTAQGFFTSAERLLKSNEGFEAVLYTLAGFRYCDLLLSLELYSEVLQRASVALSYSERKGFILDQGLDHLALARALLASGRWGDAACKVHVDGAMNLISVAGDQTFMVNALLMLAAWERAQGNLNASHSALSSARDICDRLQLPLLRLDCDVEAARNAIAEDELDNALSLITQAQNLSLEVGYGVRANELAKLREKVFRPM